MELEMVSDVNIMVVEVCEFLKMIIEIKIMLERMVVSVMKNVMYFWMVIFYLLIYLYFFV